MDPEKEELYQELILDHNRTPRHFHVLESHSHTASNYNAICGDRLTIYLKISDNRIVAASFEGRGCAISTASASMMTTILPGMALDEAEELFRFFRETLFSDGEVNEGILGELSALTGVRRAPTRIKCALLAWEAMRTAIHRPAVSKS